MAQGNNIDDLFKQKLAGREVGYSDSGWAGAEQLLNQHYKLLFWKKLGLFLLPAAILIGGVTFALWPTETIVDTEFALPSQESISNDGVHSASVSIAASSSKVMEPALHSAAGAKTKNTLGTSSSSPTSKTSSTDNVAINDVKQSQRTGLTESSGDAKQTSSDHHSIAVNERQKPESGKQSKFTRKGNDTSKGQHENLLASLNSSSPLAVAKRNSRKDMQQMPWSSLTYLGSPSGDVITQESQYPSLGKTRVIMLRANGGLLASNQLENTGTVSGSAPLGAYGGLDFQWFFAPKVSLGLGANAHSRSALSSQYTYEASQGEENSILANYIDFSLAARWNVLKRHSLGLGVAIAPLVNVYKATIDESGANNRGFDRSGFAEVDAAGMLYYQFMMTERWNFDASFRYGFFDVTDNQYFGGAAADDRNHQLRIGVSYLLLQR